MNREQLLKSHPYVKVFPKIASYTALACSASQLKIELVSYLNMDCFLTI